MSIIFLISAMAETARAPFDLTEAESELVAGYQTEYSSMSFALFWLGEYGNVLLMCGMTAVLFWGGWLPPIDWAPLTMCLASSGSSSRCCLLFHLQLGEGHRAALPLRPADAAGLEVFLPISLVWCSLCTAM
jgi:NADH-quinone oxidoreductase subunit H